MTNFEELKRLRYVYEHTQNKFTVHECYEKLKQNDYDTKKTIDDMKTIKKHKKRA